MAEAIAGTLLQFLAEKIASGSVNLILKHLKKKFIDPKTIDDLKKRLTMVAAMLYDAQQQRIQRDTMTYKIWVAGLQDLAYDLDDILDELDADEQIQRLTQADDDGSKTCNTACLQSAKTKVKSILSYGSRAIRRFHYHGSGDLPSKIEDMITRLQNSHAEGQDLGLSDRVIELGVNYSREVVQQSSRLTTSLVDEGNIYGREDKKKDIIQKLLKDKPSEGKYIVIPIVGNGGIGKTTLVRLVYNDHQLKDHFQFMAWVCVSDQDFDVTRVTTDIVKSATMDNFNSNALELAQQKLAEKLKGKRFLIVLDDVWTEKPNDWNKLKIPFQHGASGSKVIVTTRFKEIAKMMLNNPNHDVFDLDYLSDDDCWNIFSQRLNHNVDKDLAMLKTDVLKKCGGLPLAAKALGDLFKIKTDTNQRQSLLHDNIWSEKGEVLPVLRLSYFHLPSELKPVFAYCSTFPSDYEFKETEIILLWMAQGFLPEKHNERIEDIGHQYFLELISRSLLERSPSHKERYIMHDLVHELSRWAAGDICRVVTNTRDMQKDMRRTRHLNLCTGVANQVVEDKVVHQLRTFIGPTKEHKDGLREFPYDISRFRCIRSLFVASDSIACLPKSVGDLKHLRYLNVEFPKITKLPKSIGKLCNLQMLFLSRCCDLKKVTNISFLSKLRHLNFHQSLWEAMPLGIRKLTNLQTLGEMHLGEDHQKGSMIRELRNLNSLHGELSVVGIQNVRKVEDAKEAKLSEKRGLAQLHFKWSQGWHEDIDDETKRDVLEELKPNSCIKECELDGYMGLTLPTWLGDSSFQNMVNVKLVNCEKCDSLPPMEQLPSLKKLCIEGMKMWAGWVHGDMVTFRRLEELIIRNCDSFLGNLQTHLPLVKIITIVDCPKARVTFPNSPHLEELKIDNCEALLSSTSETMVICRCSKQISLRKIKSGMISLEVDGPCHGSLKIKECESVVTIKKIPDTLKKMVIKRCEKLERVEFEESPTSNNNNHNISINIEYCDSVVSVGNIPLTVGRLDIECCKSLKAVMCGRNWNLFNSSEATVGGNGGDPLKLSHLELLRIWRCPQFMSLPEGLLLPSIDYMSFINNENQNALPNQMHSFTSLSILNIINCPKFPVEGLPRNITWLNIEEMKIKKEIITRGLGLDGINKLKTIFINKVVFGNPITECIEIEGKDNVTTGEDDDDKVKEDEAASESQELSSYRCCLPSSCLSSVVTGGFNCLPSSCFPNLMLLPQPQPQTQTLDDCIDIDHKPKHTHINENASNSITLYLSTTSLDYLSITGLENLKSINCSTFPNLTAMRIIECPKLESLGPDNCLPPKLEEVWIAECPLIQKQCTPDPNGRIRFEFYSDERYTISKKQIHS